MCVCYPIDKARKNSSRATVAQKKQPSTSSFEKSSSGPTKTGSARQEGLGTKDESAGTANEDAGKPANDATGEIASGSDRKWLTKNDVVSRPEAGETLRRSARGDGPSPRKTAGSPSASERERQPRDWDENGAHAHRPDKVQDRPAGLDGLAGDHARPTDGEDSVGTLTRRRPVVAAGGGQESSATGPLLDGRLEDAVG